MNALWRSPFAPLSIVVLPAFFALSGYLVSGSLGRNSMLQFVALRALRIIPALAVEITLSGVILGTIFTTLPLRQYLVSPEFHHYFLNIIGIIHYTLPGVFGGKMLNAQLWTIPAELKCYILLVLASLVGLTRRPRVFLALLCVGCAAFTWAACHYLLVTPHANLPGRILVFSFAFGCMVYFFRERLPYSLLLFAACAFISYFMLSVPWLTYLATIPIAYATIFIGLQRWRRIPFGDLSYGIYLFHFPVARTINEMTGQSIGPVWLFLLTLPVTLAFASLSWRFVEKPILDRKNFTLAAITEVETRISRLLKPTTNFAEKKLVE